MTWSPARMTNGIAGTIIAAVISAEFRRPWPRKSIHAAIGKAMLIAIADTDGTGCRRSPWEYDDSPVMARKTPTPAAIPTHIAADISTKCSQKGGTRILRLTGAEARGTVLTCCR